MSGRIRTIVSSFVFLCAAPAFVSAQLPETAGLVTNTVTITGGVLGSSPVVASALNSVISDQITSGELRSLIEIRDLQDATAQDDGDISIALYVGIDQDGNPSDDFVGAEPFDIDPTSVLPDGSPFAVIPNGSITGGFLLAGPTSLDFGLGAPISNVTVSGMLLPGAAAFTSDPLDGSVPENVLQTTPAPPPFFGSMADLLAVFGVNPDVDLSGDGVPDAYSVTFILSAVSCTIVHAVVEPMFVRGDTNNDTAVNVADAIFLLAELFSGGPAGPCEEAGDINQDAAKNIADAVFLLGFLFSGGFPPVSPFPTCGVDFDSDAIPCTLSAACP